jgi:hypothetical protein
MRQLPDATKLRFYRAYRKLASTSAIADVLDLPRWKLFTLCGAARPAARPMSRAGLRLAWDDFRRTGQMRRFWRHDGANAPWSDADIEELFDLVGKMPLACIARRIGRTRKACVRCLERSRDWSAPISLAALIQRLRVGGPYIRAAVADHHLRSYSEGRRLYIHIEDARWMLENYRLGKPIPKHPGKEL